MDLANLFVGYKVLFNDKQLKVVSVATREDLTSVFIQLELDKEDGIGMPFSQHQEGKVIDPSLKWNEGTPSLYSRCCYIAGCLLYPGDGYRLLAIGEFPKKGDEICWDEEEEPRKWELLLGSLLDEAASDGDQPCRRKI